MKIILNNFSWIYGYGMNGQESVDEVSGSKSHYIAEFWMYDSRIGKRWNVDPMTGAYPWLSPYAAFNNNPIFFSDPLGLEGEPESKGVTDPNGNRHRVGREGVGQTDDRKALFNSSGQTLVWSSKDDKDEFGGTGCDCYIPGETQETFSGPVLQYNNKINPDGTISRTTEVGTAVSLVNHWENPMNSILPKSSWELETDYNRTHRPRPQTVEGTRFATVSADPHHSHMEAKESEFMSGVRTVFGGAVNTMMLSVAGVGALNTVITAASYSTVAAPTLQVSNQLTISANLEMVVVTNTSRTLVTNTFGNSALWTTSRGAATTLTGAEISMFTTTSTFEFSPIVWRYALWTGRNPLTTKLIRWTAFGTAGYEGYKQLSNQNNK